MTDAVPPILAIRKLPLIELLTADLDAIATGAKGQLLLGLPAGKRPSVGDDALLIDYDFDTAEDIRAFVHEGVDYAIEIDMECLQDVMSVHDASDTADERLKSLLYYLEFDAYYDGSKVADENWSTILGTERRK
jgi:hypothetical protein